VAVPEGRGVVTILEGVDLPHGLAFRSGYLYIGETGRIARYRYDPSTLGVGDGATVVRGLPHAGHHWTRSIVFGADDRLYVAIGSSCDICQERDPRRAAIVRYNADGSGEQLFATGLRNPVGLAFHPTTASLWTTVNERDWPGGGAPPDYVTEVRGGAAYGWPNCFAARRLFHRDPTLAGGTCQAMTLPTVELAPHSAPLGLVFYTGAQFPSAYFGDLFVALHGSRAGLPSAGYRIVRVRFRVGRPPRVEDFSIGGRPVDLAVGRDGSLYVSDDHADRVYRITYARP
jgi:glucose/arabinose dehydrogenase